MTSRILSCLSIPAALCVGRRPHRPPPRRRTQSTAPVDMDGASQDWLHKSDPSRVNAQAGPSSQPVLNPTFPDIFLPPPGIFVYPSFFYFFARPNNLLSP